MSELLNGFRVGICIGAIPLILWILTLGFTVSAYNSNTQNSEFGEVR